MDNVRWKGKVKSQRVKELTNFLNPRGGNEEIRDRWVQLDEGKGALQVR